MRRSEAMGRMYCGKLEDAIKHFRENIGEPVAIYCNKEEFKNTDLQRITELVWPKKTFILTEKKPQQS